MEMRYVRKRSRRRGRRNTFSPGIVLLIAVFAATAYFVGASKLGTWLAASVIAPWIASQPDGSPAPIAIVTPDQTPELESRSIALPAICAHAIQIGVYAERENADAQAARLRELGAAGYILEDDGRFRVLAAGYPDEMNMDKVREQLLTEGIDSRAYEIPADGLRLHISGTEEVLQEAEAAMAFAAALPEKLFQAAIAFDKEKKTSGEGRGMAAALSEECLHHADAMESDEEAVEALSAIAAYLRGMSVVLSETVLSEEEHSTPVSSALKRAYLTSVIRYQDMTAGLDDAP